MRIPSQVSRASLRFNITPLIDVVFLLIIFFLVASHLARNSPQAEVNLPDAQRVQAEAPAENLVTVTIDSDGRLFLGTQPITVDELDVRLQTLAEEQAAVPEVRLRGDRDCEFRFIEPILLRCARLGITNVKFAVRRDG